MSRLSFRVLEEQAAEMRRLLFVDENESAVLALCGRSLVPDPWDGGADERFIVRELIEVPPEAYFNRSPDEFTWSTSPFFRAVRIAEARGWAVAVVHSHPQGGLAFSTKDDVADQELFDIAFNRLDGKRPHLSAIMTPDGRMIARAYGPDMNARRIANIATIGERWRFDMGGSLPEPGPEMQRQVLAFGAASTRTLSQLRIGVVGCGGTGSAVASLLTRIGVRRLALFDADQVNETNLNRLHFSTRSDASLNRLKVDVVAEGAANIGLPMQIVRVPHFADRKEALNVLRACDLVFGCTDDHLGREVLNRLAHFYFIPVIDLGVLIEPSEAGGYGTFDGRVTVIQPGYACQGCRSLIDGGQLYLDSLRRDPELLAERRRAGYVPDDPDPSPVVVTFTTETATMAVNELLHRLNGFRGEENCSERVRQFHHLKDADVLPAGKSRADCPLCGERKFDGRGDMKPLLNMTL